MTGKELKEIRERKGLDREALALKIGVRYVTIWRWENEKTKIKKRDEQAIVAVLDKH